MRVSGPTSISVGEYNRVKFYILSDIHEAESGLCKKCVEPECYSLINWLKNEFNSGKVIDFYLETPSTPIYVPPKSFYTNRIGFIQRVAAEFYPCLIHRHCPYSNVRVHYLDIRSYHKNKVEGGRFSQGDMDDYLLDRAARLLDKIDYDYLAVTDALFKIWYKEKLNLTVARLKLTSNNYLEDIYELLNPLLVKFDAETRYDILQHVVHEPLVSRGQHKVRKQLAKLEEEDQEELAEIIQDFILNKLELNNNNISHYLLWDHFYHQLTEGGEEVDEAYNQLEDSADNSQVYLQDAYTLGRLFRQFNPRSTERIVFVGQYHTKNLLQFFTHRLAVKFTTYPHQPHHRRCVALS